MKIVDSKETIEFNGKKYQLHKKTESLLIGGKQLQFRQVIPVKYLKISIMLNETLIFYRLHKSKLSPFSMSLINTIGDYVEDWRILPNPINNFNLEINNLLLRASKVKTNSKINIFLNSIK